MINMVRDLIRGALDRDYRILEASGYSEAVDQLKHPLDIALSDGKQCKHNGPELCGDIKCDLQYFRASDERRERIVGSDHDPERAGKEKVEII